MPEQETVNPNQQPKTIEQQIAALSEAIDCLGSAIHACQKTDSARDAHVMKARALIADILQ